MTGRWSGNSATNRSEELPDDWAQLRAEQLDRDDHRCVWKLPSGARCPNEATDVDHYGPKWDHTRLRSLCSSHHDKRTALQGMQEAARRRATPRRRKDPHPSSGWA